MLHVIFGQSSPDRIVVGCKLVAMNSLGKDLLGGYLVFEGYEKRVEAQYSGRDDTLLPDRVGGLSSTRRDSLKDYFLSSAEIAVEIFCCDRVQI